MPGQGCPRPTAGQPVGLATPSSPSSRSSPGEVQQPGLTQGLRGATGSQAQGSSVAKVLINFMVMGFVLRMLVSLFIPPSARAG